MRWTEIFEMGSEANGGAWIRLRRRLADIASETTEERSIRLNLMYGIGCTDAEKDAADLAAQRSVIALNQAKIAQAEADAMAKLAKALNADEQTLTECHPWPSSGNRSLNERERHDIWVRCSRVAGYPLPRYR